MKNPETVTTRRDFLKQAGLASAFAASFCILPGCATTGNNTKSKPPSGKVNIALIGCGSRMGSGLFPPLLKMDDVRVVAAVDPFKDRRESYAQRANETYGGNYCKAVEDFRDVLADPDVDGVIIATQDSWHVPIAIAAARSGKDMYVEKPLGLDVPHSQILQKEIRNRGLIFQYGTQQHSSLSGRQAVEMVQNGYVGKITHCDVWSPAMKRDLSVPIKPEETIPEGLNYDLWLGPAPQKHYFAERVHNWYGSWHCYDYALGFIAGWGAHPLDMLQWGLDLEDTVPVLCEGTGAWNKAENELCKTVHTWDCKLKYENGIDVRFMDSVTAEPLIKKFHPPFKGNGVVYYGSEGYVVHSRGGVWVNRQGKYERVNEVDFAQFKKKAVQSPGHMRNFIESMKSRKDPVSTIEAAMRSDAISHLGNVAVRSGKKLEFDPKSFKITNEPNLNEMLSRPQRAPWDIV